MSKSLSVLAFISSVALADFTVGVPRPVPPLAFPQTARLVATDGGVASSSNFTISVRSPGDVARAVLLFVSEVGTPGQVTLQLSDGGIAAAFIDQPGWHEWELPAPTAYGTFVLETVSADVTFKFLYFDHLGFPSVRHSLGGLSRAGSGPCTGVLRLAGGGHPTGCAAPNDDRLAGIPYVDAMLLAAGVERQRMREVGDLFTYNNPLAFGWTEYDPQPIQITGFDGRVQGPDTTGRFVHAITDLTDGGMTAPFFLDFASDGGNLWAAYSHPPDACHPAARAALDGDQSRWMGGPAGSDLIIRVNLVMTWQRYVDLDQDGFRGESFEWRTDFTSPPAIFDCDDADPLQWPGAPEQCNGADDDCDGMIDGANVLTTRCERTLGICAPARHQVSDCQGGQWLTCEMRGRYPASFSPEELRCDSVDEDCDGVVDDSPTPVSCALTLGVCAAAPLNESCVSGAWAACDYGPLYELREESCDGLDNDCDGLTDSVDLDVEPPLCERAQGVCAGARHSRSACNAMGWQSCVDDDYGAAFEPREVRCDGLDNDCDGLVDANDPDLGTALCENQLGVCAGLLHEPSDCESGRWLACAQGRRPPTWQATESRCDGLDNDCDGITDEGCAPAPTIAAPEPVRGCGSCSAVGGLEFGLLLMLLRVRGGSRTRSADDQRGLPVR